MAEPIISTLGIVGMKHCGAYNSATNYEKLNVVTYQGSTYCAKGNTVGNLPTNTTYWDLLAEKGGTGPQGPQGPKPVKGVDYYTDDDVADLESTLSSDVTSEVSEQLSSLVSATPKAVGSISDMVDTTKIYVLATDGHWYWYDGDSWEDGGVYQATSSIIDDFLNEESNNAVKNKSLYKAFDEVLHIDNETKEITSVIDVEMTSGYMALNGNTYSSTSLEYTNKINVKEGDIITTIPTTRRGSYNMRFVTAFNDDTAVAASGTENVDSYTVPAGINGVIITCATSSEVSQIRKKYNEEVQNYITKIYDINEFETCEYSLISLNLTDGYVGSDGSTDSNATLEYTQKISVQEGDVIYPYNNANKNSTSFQIRMLCAYTDGIAVPASGTNNPIDDYQVPASINYIIATLYKSANNTYLLRKRPITKINKSYPNSKLGYMKWSGDIGSSSNIKLDVSNVRYNTVINLTCDVTSFNKVIIGITNGETFYELCSVDSTNLTYNTNASGIQATIPHGLTIANDLAISIQNNFNLDRLNMLEDITIFSNGENFSTKANNINAYCREFYSKVTLISDNSVLPNAKFSYIMKDIDKPIWLFGDSWLSLYSSRYVYYLVQNNQANNFMINAYAGENSQNGLAALTDLIKIRQPKELIWCYGMNDGDQTHAANTNWLNALQDVIEICEDNHIELILATIPSTATINNEEKNKIVRSLGYRYFDQVKAVTDSSGNWITGYVSTDGNHTSVAGAKALYYELLGDVPEIANF